MVAIGFKIKAIGYDEINDESKKEDEIKRSIGECRRTDMSEKTE